jgi:hypothetical protein
MTRGTPSSTIYDQDLLFAMEGLAMDPAELSLRQKTGQIKEQHAWKVRMAIGVSLVIFAAKLNGKIMWEQGGVLHFGCPTSHS